MKKLNLLFVMFAMFAAMSFVSSCSKDSTTDPLSIAATQDASATLLPGSTVNFTVVVTSGNTLKTLYVIPQVAGSTQDSVAIFTSHSTSSYNATFSYTIPSTCTAGQKIQLTFSVVDKGPRRSTVAPTFTVASETTQTTALTDQGDVTLGGSAATQPSYYSVTAGAGIAGSSTATHSAVDFIFYYGDSNAASICAPSNTDVEAFSAYAVTSWTVRNTTKLFKNNSFDFANATEATLAAAYAAGTTTDAVTNLSAGDIIIFKTASTSDSPNRLGVLKVGTITPVSASGHYYGSTVVINAKVKTTATAK